MDALAADDAVLVIAEQILQLDGTPYQASGWAGVECLEELGRVAQPFGTDADLVELSRG